MKNEDPDQVGTDLNDFERMDAPPGKRSPSLERCPPTFWRDGFKEAGRWHETCRPESSPRFNLLSLGVGFIAGFLVAVVVWPHLKPWSPTEPAAPAPQAVNLFPQGSDARSAAVLPGQVVDDDAGLEALMRRSTNPESDGEGAGMQASRMALALAEVGDDRFSAVLSRQTPEVQEGVTDSISYMWRHYQLDYPKTRAIHAKFASVK